MSLSFLGEHAILLVGNLKVGKSSLFTHLVGQRQHPVCYPGSAVELLWGRLAAGPYTHLIDAPGIYSLHDHSEEGQVVRQMLLRGEVGAVLLALDAKNLRRGLTLALQLAHFDVPLVAALNMVDEARQRGIEVDGQRLQSALGVPVVATMANEKRGLRQLRRALAEARPPTLEPGFPPSVEPLAGRLQQQLLGHRLAVRPLSYLLVADVPLSARMLGDAAHAEDVAALRGAREEAHGGPMGRGQLLAEAEQGQAGELASGVTTVRPAERPRWLDRISVWSRRPLTGIPIAIVVLALFYLFVANLGATVLVDLLETRLFGRIVLPVIDGWVQQIPQAWLRELLTGHFGLITVGLVLTVGIVTPVLATFFLAFAVLEDSGYLPRLSLLLDRLLRGIGLNGKGVLPLITGFSCVTMAVLTTRVLDTRKQRLIATMLLLVAFPCAPLLGVMIVMLARLSIWASVTVLGVLLLQVVVVGSLANLVLPGRRQDFVLELPPLRAPRLYNILLKTGQRLLWFLKEAIPYFLLGSFVLYLMDQAGLLDGFRDLLRPVSVRLLGLPGESADVFLMTLVRREAGAALLVQQATGEGLYDGTQAVVALVVMTLMVPCINTVLITYKERGVLTATGILLFVMVYSLIFGGLLNGAFRLLGVQL
jgi:ferrous iron transport protein B